MTLTFKNKQGDVLYTLRGHDSVDDNETDRYGTYGIPTPISGSFKVT